MDKGRKAFRKWLKETVKDWGGEVKDEQELFELLGYEGSIDDYELLGVGNDLEKLKREVEKVEGKVDWKEI